MVRQVDSSLLDEWELLSHPDELRDGTGQRRAARLRASAPAASRRRSRPTCGPSGSWSATPASGGSNWPPNGTGPLSGSWTRTRAGTQRDGKPRSQPYFADHAIIGTGPAARGPALWQVHRGGPDVARTAGARRPRRVPRMGHRARRRPRRLGPEGGAGHRAGRASSGASRPVASRVRRSLPHGSGCARLAARRLCRHGGLGVAGRGPLTSSPWP